MTTFSDCTGRNWAITLSVDALKRVRGLIGIDLMGIVEGDLLERLHRDPVLLCDVVYAVCKPEADARSVSDADFGRAMAGDAIEHATQALLEELVLFFPSPRDRANLQRALEAAAMVMARAQDLIAQRLSALDPNALAAQALASAGRSSGSAPDAAASTPGP